jgi:hypothetical protein
MARYGIFGPTNGGSSDWASLRLLKAREEGVYDISDMRDPRGFSELKACSLLVQVYDSSFFCVYDLS